MHPDQTCPAGHVQDPDLRPGPFLRKEQCEPFRQAPGAQRLQVHLVCIVLCTW